MDALTVLACLLIVGGLVVGVAITRRWSGQPLDRDDSRTFDEHVRTALAALTPDALDNEPTPFADAVERDLRLTYIRPAAPRWPATSRSEEDR